MADDTAPAGYGLDMLRDFLKRLDALDVSGDTPVMLDVDDRYLGRDTVNISHLSVCLTDHTAVITIHAAEVY